MLPLLKMAGIMVTINRIYTITCSIPNEKPMVDHMGREQVIRMAILPSLSQQLLILLWLITSLYSVATFAHDPGLSLVDIELSDNNISAHITYAKKDIEQFVNLDNYLINDQSSKKTVTVKSELAQFINKAIEFNSQNKIINTVITEINLDKSNAVHFWLKLSSISGKELTIDSRMIDQFPLGHRQFVKVKTAVGIIDSHLLSSRNPSYTSLLPKANLSGVLFNFLLEGIWHIWIGFDHILFVVTLLLPAVLVYKQSSWHPNSGFKQVFKFTVKVISAFTIAHSITLGLTVFEIITLPSKIVEAMIAASIIVAATNNIYCWVNQRLWMIAFAFGLIHGMGFASVLNEIGMQSNTQALALLGFNVGVELGQLAIVVTLLPLLYLFRKRAFYKPVVFQSGSYVIAIVSCVWLFERLTESTVFQYY